MWENVPSGMCENEYTDKFAHQPADTRKSQSEQNVCWSLFGYLLDSLIQGFCIQT